MQSKPFLLLLPTPFSWLSPRNKDFGRARIWRIRDFPPVDRPIRARIASPWCDHTPRPADRSSPVRPRIAPVPPFSPHPIPTKRGTARRRPARRRSGQAGAGCVRDGVSGRHPPPPPSPRRHVRSGGGDGGVVAGSAALPARAFSTCRRCGPAPIRRMCRFGVSRAGGDRIQPEGAPAHGTARHQNRPSPIACRIRACRKGRRVPVHGPGTAVQVRNHQGPLRDDRRRQNPMRPAVL